MSLDYESSHARFAAAFWAQIQAEPVARSYARALWEAAKKAGVLAEVGQQLASLMEEVFPRFPEFQLFLDSPSISFEEKEGVLDRVLGPQAIPVFLNFLKVVVRRGRVSLLPEILREFRALEEKAKGQISVQVITAVALEPSERQQVSEVVRAITGKEPILYCEVDEKLIGGIVLRIGDKVYDASVVGQLRLLAQQVIDRGVHEVQSRRDRFGSPTRD
jgi:F-type H+-transporting ATPase subunit delta